MFGNSPLELLPENALLFDYLLNSVNVPTVGDTGSGQLIWSRLDSSLLCLLSSSYSFARLFC